MTAALADPPAASADETPRQRPITWAAARRLNARTVRSTSEPRLLHPFEAAELSGVPIKRLAKLAAEGVVDAVRLYPRAQRRYRADQMAAIRNGTYARLYRRGQS